MARKPTPWFPLYASELLTDERIAELTDGELGVLVKLWSKMWINGVERGTLFLSKTKPISDEKIAEFLHKNLEETQKILSRLVGEIGILRRGKFRELFSRRLRKYRTEWELRKSKLKSSSMRNGRGMEVIPHDFLKTSSSSSSSSLKELKHKDLVGSQKTEPTGESKSSLKAQSSCPPKKKSDPRVMELLKFWGWEFDEHLHTTYTASFKGDGQNLKALLKSVENNHRVPNDCTIEFLGGCMSWYIQEQKEKEDYLNPTISGFYKNFNRICVEIFREEFNWKELKKDYVDSIQKSQQEHKVPDS